MTPTDVRVSRAKFFQLKAAEMVFYTSGEVIQDEVCTAYQDSTVTLPHTWGGTLSAWTSDHQSLLKDRIHSGGRIKQSIVSNSTEGATHHANHNQQSAYSNVIA